MSKELKKKHVFLFLHTSVRVRWQFNFFSRIPMKRKYQEENTQNEPIMWPSRSTSKASTLSYDSQERNQVDLELRLAILESRWQSFLGSVDEIKWNLQTEEVCGEILDSWMVDTLSFPMRDKTKELKSLIHTKGMLQQIALTYRFFVTEIKGWGCGGFYNGACNQIEKMAQDLMLLQKKVTKTVLKKNKASRCRNLTLYIKKIWRLCVSRSAQ